MAAAKNEVPPWGLAIAGSTGAVLANALVYPLDIVKTKLQVQVKKNKNAQAEGGASAVDPHYDGTVHAILSIMEDEGLYGLYSGLAGSLIGVASTNFAYFYWYSTVRTLYLTKVSQGKAPNTATELSLGAVAGALAQLFTIPIAVVTTRQQTQSKGERKTMMETAREVIDGEDGWSGLWRGLKASMVLVVNPAITYGAYQRLREILYPNKLNLRPHEAFSEFIPLSLPTCYQLLTTVCSKSSVRSQRLWQQSRPSPSSSPKLASNPVRRRTARASPSSPSSRLCSTSSRTRAYSASTRASHPKSSRESWCRASS